MVLIAFYLLYKNTDKKTFGTIIAVVIIKIVLGCYKVYSEMEMIIKFFNTALAVCLFFLLGCSTTSSSKIGGRDGKPVEQWSNFEQSDFSEPVTDERYSRVIFVRGEHYTVGEAVNIYVNGEYLASLLAQGAASVQLCQGSNKLLASYTNIEKRYLDKQNDGQFYSIPAGKISYFQIEKNAQGNPIFRKITLEQFENMEINKQRHTLSRVDKRSECRL